MITKQSQPRAIAISSPRISSTSPFSSLLLHDAQKCERHKNQLHRFILTFMKQNGISVCVNLCCLENYISVRHHLLGFHSVVGRSLLFFHLPLVHRVAKKRREKYLLVLVKRARSISRISNFDIALCFEHQIAMCACVSECAAHKEVFLVESKRQYARYLLGACVSVRACTVLSRMEFLIKSTLEFGMDPNTIPLLLSTNPFRRSLTFSRDMPFRSKPPDPTKC